MSGGSPDIEVITMSHLLLAAEWAGPDVTGGVPAAGPQTSWETALRVVRVRLSDETQSHGQDAGETRPGRVTGHQRCDPSGRVGNARPGAALETTASSVHEQGSAAGPTPSAPSQPGRVADTARRA